MGPRFYISELLFAKFESGEPQRPFWPLKYPRFTLDFCLVVIK